VLRLPKQVSFAALTIPVPEPELWPVFRPCQQRARQGQEVSRVVARDGSHTCVELSSARSTRTRFGPLSAAMSSSSSSSSPAGAVGAPSLASTRTRGFVFFRGVPLPRRAEQVPNEAPFRQTRSWQEAPWQPELPGRFRRPRAQAEGRGEGCREGKGRGGCL